VTAMICLALGTGANTTIFSLSTEMLMSRPSSHDPERLALAWVGGGSAAAMKDYRYIRDSQIFEGLGGENEETEVNWREGDISKRLHTVRVTDNFFDVIGIPVEMGRPIEPGDTDSVVVTHRFWQRSLGGEPGVVGRTLILDGRTYTVVGLLPADHRTVTGFGFSPDLYLPVKGEDAQVTLYARLPAGMTRQIARARLKAVCEELDRLSRHRDESLASGIRVSGVSGLDRLDNDEMIAMAAFFGMLMIAVWLVLLIACANVGGMLFARGSSRSHELAVRLSLGASRGRIIRQLMAEAFLLALCGTAGGLGINFGLSALLSSVQLPLPIPFQLVIRPDFRLLAYSIIVSAICTVAAGLIPALRSTRSGISASLKPGRGQVGRSHSTVRSVLVGGQIVVSVILLCGGLVFTRNLMRAASMNPGFDTGHTVWSSVRLVPQNHTIPEQRLVTANEILEGLRRIPGVESAAIARVVPLNGHLTNGSTVRTDFNAKGTSVTVNSNYVGDDYFKTLKIPVEGGREFSPWDRKGSPRVAILNQNLAARLFGKTSPVGHVIYFGDGPALTIVGVVRNSKYFTLGEENAFACYEPYAQWVGSEELQFLIRVSGSPEASVPVVNEVIGGVDSAAAIDTKPMSRALVMALLPSRVGAAVLGAMGLLGLALAAIGLYGILSYWVSGRIQEIGLRAALGAAWGKIMWMVLRQSLALVLTGIGIGVALSAVVLPPLSVFLIPGVSPTNCVNFVVAGGILLLVAVAATISPAIRALRVDPVVALRYE